MLQMASQIELYKNMSALSRKMVEAAQTKDWTQLAALEKSVSALREQLLRSSDDTTSLTKREQEQKAALIQHILDDDAEVRRHTEPWMEQIRQLLGGDYRKRQVNKAYGANSF